MATDAECEQQFVDKALKRISNHAGVYGLLVVSPNHGRILHKSGFEDSTEICEKWADSLLSFLSVAASTVRTLDHTDDIAFLRMQWRSKHIIVCPDPNREYTIIVVQEQVHQAAPEPPENQNQTTMSAVDQLLSNTAAELGATSAPQ